MLANLYLYSPTNDKITRLETISPYAVLHVFPDPFGGSGKQTKTLTKTCNPIIKEGFTLYVLLLLIMALTHTSPIFI